MTQHDTEQNQEQTPVIELPPLRLFKVHRYSPHDGEVEELLIEAHTVNFNQKGNLLQFGVFTVDPYRGPTEFTRRCFNGWIDYEEELRYQDAPSGLIVN